MTDTGFTDTPDLNSNIYNGTINNSISGFVSATISDAQLQTITDNFVPTSDPRLELITDVTPGEATQAKALLIDNNQDLTQFRNLGFTGDLTLTWGTVGQLELYAIKSFMLGAIPGFVGSNAFLISDGDKNLYEFREISATGTMRITGHTPPLVGGAGLEISYDESVESGKFFCKDRLLGVDKRISFNDNVFVESDGSFTISGDLSIPSGSMILGGSFTSTGTLRVIGQSTPLNTGISLEISYDSIADAAKIICIDRALSAKKQISLNNTTFIEADGSLSTYGNIVSTNAIIAIGPIAQIFGTGCAFEYDISNDRGHVFAKDTIGNITKPLLLSNDFYIRSTNQVFLGTPINTPYGPNQTIGKLNISYNAGAHISFFNQTNSREYRITLNSIGNLVLSSPVSTFTFSNDSFFTSSGDIKATAGLIVTGALAHTTGNVGIFMDYSASQGRIYAKNQTGNITMPILINTDFYLRNTNEVFIGSPVNTTYGPNGTIGKVNISYTAGPHISFFCQTNSREYHITLNSTGNLVLNSPGSTFTFTNDSLFSSSGDIQAANAMFALGALAHTTSSIGCFMEYASSQGHIFAENLTGSITMPLLLNNDFYLRNTDEVFIGSPVNTPYGPNATIGKVNISYTSGPHISLFNQTNSREFQITLDSAGSLILSSPLSTFTFTNDNLFNADGDIQAAYAIVALGASPRTNTTGCFMEYASSQGHIFAKDLAGSIDKALLLNNDFLIRSTDEVFIGSPVNTPYGPNGTIGKVNISYTAGPHISLFNQTNNREYHITLDSAGSLILSSPLSIFTFTNDNSFYVGGDIQAGNALMALGALLHTTTATGCFIEYTSNQGHIFAKDLAGGVDKPLLLGNDFFIRDTNEVFIGTPLNTPYGPIGAIGKLNISYTTGPHVSLFNQTNNREYQITLNSAGSLILSNPVSTFTFSNDNLFSSSGDIQAANAMIALGALTHTTSGIGCFMEYASSQGHIFAKNLTSGITMPLLLNNDFLIRSTNEIFIGSPVNTPYGPIGAIGKLNISYNLGPHISLFNQTGNREFYIELDTDGSLILSSQVSTFTFTNDNLFSTDGDIQAGNAIVASGTSVRTNTTGCFIEYVSDQGHVFAKDLTSAVVDKALLLNNDFLIRDTNEVFIGSPVNTPYGPNGVIGKLNISYDGGPHISLFNPTGNQEYYITLESTGLLALNCLNSTFTFGCDDNEFFSSGDVRTGGAIVVSGSILVPGATGCFMEYASSQGHIFAKDLAGNINKALLLNTDFLIRATNEVFIGSPVNTPYGPNQTIGKLNISYNSGPHVSFFNQTNSREYQITLNSAGSLILSSPVSTFTFTNDSLFSSSGDIQAGNALIALGALAHLSGKGAFVHYKTNIARFEGYDYTLSTPIEMALGYNDAVRIKTDGKIAIGSTTLNSGQVNIASSTANHLYLFNTTTDNSYTRFTVATDGTLTMANRNNTSAIESTNTWTPTGNYSCATNIVSEAAGVHAYGVNNTYLSTRTGGAHMHYASGIATFLGYDYSTSTATDMSLGYNDAIRIKAAGAIFIGNPSIVSVGKVNISSAIANHLYMFNTATDNSYTRLTVATDGALTMSNHSNVTTLESANVWTTDGNYSCAKNVITEAGGVHAYGISLPTLLTRGGGAHMHYGGGIAAFFGYNYSTSAWTDMNLGNNRINIKGATGYVGIGTTTPLYPFHVATGTVNNTYTGSFGYVDNLGVGNGANFTNRPFGAFFSTSVLIGPGAELNVTSDERLKQDIIPVDDESLSKFMELTPSTFRFKHQEADDTKKHYGYRAQDVLSKQLHDFVCITKSEEPLEEQDIECVDGSIFHLGTDCKLTVNMIDMIPLLHAIIQKQEARIAQNEKIIAELLSKK